MASVNPHKRSWPRRILWAFIGLILFIVLAIIALRIFITTPSGAKFIEEQVNTRSFGAIEKIEIGDLSGNPLDVFRLGSLKIYDKDGVWLTANNITMDWSPFSILRRNVQIENLAIERADVLRRPNLNTPEPSTGPGYNIRLDSFAVTELAIKEEIIGQAGIFKIDGQFKALPSGSMDAKLNALRLDATGDELDLVFNRADSSQMTGNFTLNGAPNGTLATLLQTPQGEPVTGTGTIQGTQSSGEGNIIIAFDNAEKVKADVNWSESEANLTADIETTNWAIFDSVRRGIGEQINATSRIDRTQKPYPFTASVKAPALSITAYGRMNENGGVPKQAQITAQFDDLGAIVIMPESYAAGSAGLQGLATISPNLAFDGRMTVNNINTPHGSTAEVKGPVAIRQRNDNMFAFTTDISLEKLKTTQHMPIELGSSAKIKSNGTLNLEARTVTLASTEITSGKTKITSKGQLAFDGSNMEISGTLRAGVKARGSVPAGDLQTTYNARKTSDSLLDLSLDGAFKPSTAPAAPFDQLLDEGINFKVDMSPVEGGINIKSASVAGENIRAAMQGRVTDTLDVQGEALLREPFTYNSVALSGDTDVSFNLIGPRSDPDLRLDGSFDKITVSNYELNKARLRAEISDLLQAPKGPLSFEAQTAQGELTLNTNFASRPDAYIANDIGLTWGRLSAAGDLSVPPDGLVTGDIRLNLPEEGDQYARATANFSAANGEQLIRIDAEGKNVAIGDFGIDTFTAKANGTLSQLTGTINAEGRRSQDVISREFAIKFPFSASRNSDGSYLAKMTPDATYSNLVLKPIDPVTLRFQDGDITLDAPLRLNDGPVTVNYTRIATAETLAVKAERLPVTLIPMPGNLADSRGRISADFDIKSDISGQSGGGTITLTDWRGFNLDRGTGLSGDLNVNLNGPQAQWTLAAASAQGFKADSTGRFSLDPSQSLAGLRLNMGAPVQGQFTASGEAATILSLFTPSDANPGGQINANLSLTGTAANPLIEGQINGQALQMEAPDLGTRVRNGRFKADFTNDTIRVTDVYIADADDGTLTGEGDFKLGELGRPIGQLNIKSNNFRALDRRDYEGRVDGDLTFASDAKRAKLSGNVKIDRAEVKQFVQGNAAVVVIDVEEINRPEEKRPVEIKAPATPIDLDVRVRAPRRIFVRTRGLDVELSLDANIKGTIAAVEIFGEANVLRGGYKIAGKELEFTTGTIKFNGKLADATVNLLAETETQNLSAQVKITGTVAKPEIELSSTPDRPKDEILSALLFGRSATELSAIEAAQLAGALAQFSGKGGGFDLMGGLRDALGVGQLSVGLSDDGTAQITGGRYLAKDVYLQVFSGGGQGQTGAIIDWEIRKNISLRSKVRADNEQSFSLKWKRDF